jgi:hypothetical protein
VLFYRLQLEAAVVLFQMCRTASRRDMHTYKHIQQVGTLRTSKHREPAIYIRGYMAICAVQNCKLLIVCSMQGSQHSCVCRDAVTVVVGTSSVKCGVLGRWPRLNVHTLPYVYAGVMK